MASEAPTVSVVVPTRNRARRVRRLLAALARQTLDARRFELLVVDDGSTDSTADVLRSFAGDAECSLVTIRGRGAGPAAARNIGWRAAQAALIAFTDDDCEPTPTWLEAGVAAAADRPRAFVQGPTSPVRAELEVAGPLGRTKSIERPGPWYQTCNIFYPRAILLEAGGFDEAFEGPFGEDTDLAWRALTLGAEALWEPRARVHHAVEPQSSAAFVRSGCRDPDEVLVFKRHAGLRAIAGHWRVFKSQSHAYLALALLGATLARRRPALLALAAPYLRLLLARRRASGASTPQLAAFVGYDLLETASSIRGSIRHRFPAL